MKINESDDTWLFCRLHIYQRYCTVTGHVCTPTVLVNTYNTEKNTAVKSASVII